MNMIASQAISGVWMLIFTLPVLLLTPDAPPTGWRFAAAAKAGIQDVLETVKQVRTINVAIYPLARMLYNDGMVGVGSLAACMPQEFEWDTISLLIGLCTSVTAMFGAYLGGIMDDRLGSLLTLKVCVPMTAMILLTRIDSTRSCAVFGDSLDRRYLGFPLLFDTSRIIYFATNQVFAFFVTALSASRTLMARISRQIGRPNFWIVWPSGSITAFLAPLCGNNQWSASQRWGFASYFVNSPWGIHVVLG